MSGPTAEPARKLWYLKQPNYYRLAYNAAAMRINLALEKPEEAEPAQHGVLLEEGLQKAMALSSKARSQLEAYEHTRTLARPWNPFRRPLGPKQEKLRRFLAESVIPCAELAIAGVHIYRGEASLAEAHAAPLRRMNDLSYRACYNFACYETARASSPSVGTASIELAFVWLKKALERAPGPRRATELASWAERDPSLAPLAVAQTSRSRFEELLSRYKARPFSSRAVYNVSPDRGRWTLTHKGSVVKGFDTKDEAVEEAVSAARRNVPSSLVIRRQNGTFQERRDYNEADEA